MPEEEDVGSFRLRRLAPVQLVTYLVARATIAVVSALPPRLAERAGRLVGRFMYLVDSKHRKLAHKNLERTGFMDLAPRQRASFVRRVYEHFGRSIVENLRLPRLLAGGRLGRETRIENRAVLDAVLARGKGAMLAVAHMGNWELAGLAVAAAGYPLYSIVRTLENPRLDRYWNALRTMTGQRVIPKDRAVAEMVRVFRENGILVILADLDARDGGVFLPFLGRPASTTRSPALFAMRYAAPIVPIEVWRGDDGVHHMRFSEPIEAALYESTEQGVADIMGRVNARLEEFVRRHPTQWMWLHGRWKTAGRVLRKAAEQEALRGSPTSGP
jgi:Kdo2-lipid IVA lauroyltransferase/acyltransferase